METANKLNLAPVMEECRSHELRRLSPRNVTRSLWGATAHSRDGRVLLDIMTKKGTKLPRYLLDLVPSQLEYSFFEGFFLGCTADCLIVEVDHRDMAWVSHVSISLASIDYCCVNYGVEAR
jgi:hypothetical protein